LTIASVSETKISEGKVSKIEGLTFTLISGSTEFSITVTASYTITSIKAESGIPYKGGITVPILFDSADGTFTLTGIPSEYNGKYAVFAAYDSIVGFQSYNKNTDTITLPRILNGSVSIPLWKEDNFGNPVRYSGNDTFNVTVVINSSEKISGSGDDIDPLDAITFDSIKFTNGNASKSWVSAYSLDGIWENSEGMRITVSGSTGVYTALGSGALQSALWPDAVSKGYIAVGKQFWRNITSTGNLTWSGQQLGITFNPSNPNVATGTGWTDGTLTMSADGKTLTGVFGGAVTWTRVYSLDGIWENSEGMRITVSGSTGVYSALGSGESQHQMWHDAVSKGYIAVGKQFWRNITSTGSSTWSGQQLGITYNSSNPNIATGTGWTDGTLTMGADGKTLTGVFGGAVIWTRKQ